MGTVPLFPQADERRCSPALRPPLAEKRDCPHFFGAASWLVLLFLLGGTGRAQEWEPLFNGRDLDGWTPKIVGHEVGDNYGETFRVANGLLEVSYDQYEAFGGRFGHLFHDAELESYRLRVEYRFVGEQLPDGPEWARLNSGVMLHAQSPESMARDQAFPVSIELQLLGAEGAEERPTANLCTPGTHVEMEGELVTRHCTLSSAPSIPPGQWVTVEVEVQGDTFRHFVEGALVLEYEAAVLDETDPEAARLMANGSPERLRRGTIAIQSESHPIQFRRIEIQRLPPLADGSPHSDE